MHDHVSIQHDFNFSEILEIPSDGRSGGIAIMWMHNMITVDEVVREDQELYAMIKVIPNQNPWLVSTIYASTDSYEHKLMWYNLTNIYEKYKVPWLVIGDFNDVFSSEEKWGGRPVNFNKTTKLWNLVKSCELFDLGFKGPKYTWTNYRKRSKGLIMERLDRCFVNEGWVNQYPNAIVDHLP
ncbi:uncharacterized protein [Nicotiana sylvestris]|uniref:uncharacterized protein n=1 Tax=Nicotiana sylvestris TaxID=4096 RepID=UPI00388CE1E8